MTGRLLNEYTARVPEMTVMGVPEPKFTKTWHPICHARLIKKLGEAVEYYGFEVKKKEYSLSANAMKMFGVWTVVENGGRQGGSENGEVRKCIGIKNSMDKSMAVGLVAGVTVLICDNLAFSGDFVELRRHTSGLSDETLAELCLNGVGKIQGKLADFLEWHKGLKDIEITQVQAEHLTFDAMVSGAMSPGKFNALHVMYFEAAGKYNDGSLYGWHGAVTELMKGTSLMTVSNKNKKLTKLIKDFRQRPPRIPWYKRW